MSKLQFDFVDDLSGSGDDGFQIMNHPYGVPVTFDHFSGFYLAGRADRQGRKAVLLLSPIGYEELCSRVTWRALAGMIAVSGHACLRFDYPGTADAIDSIEAPDGIADWLLAARHCTAFLRDHNPGADLVLVGQGFGASLACQLAADTSGVTAAVLMAPVVKGRAYLRELQAWSRVLTERMGIAPDPLDESGYCVAGFPLQPVRAAAIKSVDLTQANQPPATRVLVVDRTQVSRKSSIGNHLEKLGADVSYVDYAGYEQILQNPSLAEPQLGTLRHIVSWIDETAPSSIADAGPPPSLPEPARPIVGPHFQELPVRFGPDERLFGVLCRPIAGKSSGIAVLANSGRDYHIGWGRAAVEQARALAERGFASFRFDGGAIGDSVESATTPEEVLYSDEQLTDLRYAIDYAAALDAGPIAVVGRCSGAYGAFQAAVRDERVRKVVVINIMRFVWDPAETVAEALQSAHRTVGGSVAMLFSKQSLRRLLSGNLRIMAPIAFFAKRFVRSISTRVEEIRAGLPRQTLYSEGHRRFEILEKRGVRLAMVFSEGDHALGEFRTYMGRTGARLRRYPGASISIVPDADHNFTHSGARARLTKVLCDLLAPTSSLPHRD